MRSLYYGHRSLQLLLCLSSDAYMSDTFVQVEMTTGATIHTTKGLKMTVTGRTRPPIIPTLETKVVTVDGDLQLSSTLSNAAAISSGAPKEDQQDEISTAAHQSQQVTG
ncbi:hypothetical protein BHE74_00056857 [Ensete ventricosum]|uniref:Uncharacterized protein n=1 Tax=Ensete ventricosum TaxID=4639 RepID=A0A427AE10_ENSVE|nr:hypothetical protein B296_00022688 [Ensete ventricosum]RWW37961.1 hypothetical protein BHE74_00056857 [Ensete ventricosum]